MKITRTFARANHLTFSIPPIKGLLERYVGNGVGWADPFARDSKVAELTNDIDTNTSAKFHLEALEFCNKIEGKLDGVLFDPPYSYRQISDHYKSVGLKATGLDTSYNFYRRVQVPLAGKIKSGGIAISFGWNTNGFGKKLGFEIIEIMIVAHGLHHNDTLVTVEKLKLLK